MTPLEQARRHFEQGMFFFCTADYANAEICFRQAHALIPDRVSVLTNLSAVLLKLNRLEEAFRYAKQAVEIDPKNFQAWTNLGLCNIQQNQFAFAKNNFDQALLINSDYAEAHNGRGIACKESQLSAEAETSFKNALRCNPDYQEALKNLGGLLIELDRPEEAEFYVRQAINLASNSAAAHCQLGIALYNQNRLTDAANSYQTAITLDPGLFDAHYNLGVLRQFENNLLDAETCYRTALTLEPESAKTLANLALVLDVLGKQDDATECYQKALLREPDYALGRSSFLFSLCSQGKIDPAAYLSEAQKWQSFSVPEHVAAAARTHRFHNPPPNGRRLRIGYISGDFRQHAISYFVEPLFKLHDRKRFEVFAYPTSSIRDQTTQRLERLVEHWRQIDKFTDDDACAVIRKDSIDLLVDLSGHTLYNRLGIFARRAAPVQLHYLGFYASTGLQEMDYWIGDPILIPPTDDRYYTETVWRLPRIWVSYRGDADAPQSRWQPDDNGTIWLGSFNHLSKITPATLTLWAKILLAMPEAKLMLKTKALEFAPNRERIEKVLRSRGVTPDRLLLLGNTPDWAAHMRAYDRLDLALDPVGAVGGGTTTCDALWMGVPVVTLAGPTMAQRMTASMLHALGHPEWIANSPDDYIDKCIDLARNLQLRQSLRTKQRTDMQSCDLCDSPGLVRALEQAYTEMLHRSETKISAHA